MRTTIPIAFVTAAAFALGASPSLRAEPAPVPLELASTFGGSMPILGVAARDLAEKVARASNGRIVVRFHEPGELVPAAETVRAVSDGRVTAAWAGAGWFADDDSAFNFFSTVPFGPDMGEYMAWMYEGGGLALAREMFARRDVFNIPCGMIPPEASGWFRREIRSVDDLKGLRMRFFGLGALVMRKLGVATEQIAPGDILARLEDGSLDAAEFSLPAMDEPLGFQKVAKYYYFPGWHQQATFFDLDINLKVWEGLDTQAQSIIELACSDVMRDMIARGEARQAGAIRRLQAEGVEVRRWAPRILVAMEDAWRAVVTEESARNPDFKRVYESYASFRADYRIWHALSYLN
ncbi:MAG: TRAP transporter substrate-binding protein [Hyphomicrobiaceae bacterium]|nr:TRAP transporter substrate-binding protein [Hyphomicrobiaceae bacterium]